MSRRGAGGLGRTAGALVLLLPLMVGCVAAEGATPQRTPDGTPSIALLLPEAKTSRYESVDRPVFVDTVAEQCPECEVLYVNAGGDAARQQDQAEAVLVSGVDVLVLDAVDAAAARAIVIAAEAQGVRVVAYDRFVESAPVDFYVAYDGEEVGRLQGEALVSSLGEVSEGSGILMVHGAAADPNAAALKAGALAVIEEAGLTVLAEYDTPDWAPDKAQAWVEAQLTEFGDRVVGVYAANDGTAGGAISALRAGGRVPVPPVTGHDAELAAIQRIVAGDQTMTVHKQIAEQASAAAGVAVQLARGQDVPTSMTVDGVPALLLRPEAVTRADVRTLVGRGVFDVQDVCVKAYRAACLDLGLVVP